MTLTQNWIFKIINPFLFYFSTITLLRQQQYFVIFFYFFVTCQALKGRGCFSSNSNWIYSRQKVPVCCLGITAKVQSQFVVIKNAQKFRKMGLFKKHNLIVHVHYFTDPTWTQCVVIILLMLKICTHLWTVIFIELNINVTPVTFLFYFVFYST